MLPLKKSKKKSNSVLWHRLFYGQKGLDRVGVGGWGGREAEWSEFREAEFLTVSKACEAIFWLTPGVTREKYSPPNSLRGKTGEHGFYSGVNLAYAILTPQAKPSYAEFLIVGKACEAIFWPTPGVTRGKYSPPNLLRSKIGEHGFYSGLNLVYAILTPQAKPIHARTTGKISPLKFLSE